MKDYSKQVEASLKTLAPDFVQHRYQMIFDTSMGQIKVTLYPHLAPKHCENIMALAHCGFYDGLTFHRIVPNFVIQGGCPQGNGAGGPGFQVAQEFNSQPHVLGTLSMARAQHPDSAGSQFFLCLGELPFLDRQYTVFGQAEDEESLKVIKQIGAVKTASSDMPIETVTIQKATVYCMP